MASTSVCRDASRRAGNESSDKDSKSVGHVVANHYNSLDEKGLAERTQSRIFYLRNFNNWVKSMLISEYLHILRAQNSRTRKDLQVLDLACGKGGDLLKWMKAEIDYLVCADIAATSIEQCENRYRDMGQRSGNSYGQKKQTMFAAEFIAADCTKERLRDRYKRKDVTFDLVSCQFSFHYCFESLPQVERMLLNVAECLRPGGFFIGTTPDAHQIVSRLRDCDGMKFGNDVYSVTFSNRDEFPLFGAKYDFHLEGVVDCPEFLVYFPLLEKLAEKHDLRLVCRKRFDEYFAKVMQDDSNRADNSENGRQLLGRMQALETYPPFDGGEVVGDSKTDYVHARERVDELEKRSDRRERVGTLSQSEWDAISMYVVFAFEKITCEGSSSEAIKDDAVAVEQSKPHGKCTRVE